MNSSFDCPNKAGVMCKSVDQINRMVDTGELQGRAVQSSSITTNNEFQPYSLEAGYYPGAPLRYGETVQRIWLAPYEDSESNYHQDSMMYAIVKKGHWIGSPIRTSI